MRGRHSYLIGLSKTFIIVGVFCLVFSPIGLIKENKAQAQAGGVGAIAGNIAVCLGIGGLFTFGSAAAATVGVATKILSVPVSDASVELNTGMIAASSGLTAGNTSSAVSKECALDSIAYGIAKIILEDMANNFIDYINNGFEGDPFFISSPGDYFKGLADEIVGEFIASTGLEFLCKPFQLQLRNALKIQYGAGGKSRHRAKGCTLTDIVGNVDSFVEGNFEDGSWLGFFEITQNPVNNPVGSFLNIQFELDDRIANKLGVESKLLDWNSGFFSQTVTNPDGSKSIVTPGSQIENQLALHLGSGVRQLELADEFNEILGALFNQLLQQVFSKTGLSGYVKQNPNGDTTYEDDIETLTEEANIAIEKAYALVKEYKDKMELADVSTLDFTIKIIQAAIQMEQRSEIATQTTFLLSTIAEVRKKLGLEPEDRLANAIAKATVELSNASVFLENNKDLMTAGEISNLSTLIVDLQSAIDLNQVEVIEIVTTTIANTLVSIEDRIAVTENGENDDLDYDLDNPQYDPTIDDPIE